MTIYPDDKVTSSAIYSSTMKQKMLMESVILANGYKGCVKRKLTKVKQNVRLLHLGKGCM